MLLLLLVSASAYAGPRDYVAILNRCGSPTLGDTTIYENNTVAGGRKIVKYLRGTINFNRVGNDGWTFASGEHGKETGLSADQMAEHMPCITQALADSASPEPLPTVNTNQRIEFSAAYHQRLLLVFGGALVLLIVAGFFFGGRRKTPAQDEQER